MELNKIYNLDCLEGLKLLKDSSIDCVITDPPYNIAKSGDIFKIKQQICSTKDSFGHYDIFEDDEYLEFMEKIIIEFSRVCKDGSNILIFLGREYVNIIERIFNKYGFKTKNTVAIIKKNPLPHFRKNGLRSGFELGLWLCKGGGKPKSFNFLSQELMINYDHYVIGQKDTEHPNEKPVKILEKYIKILSNENDIILDCFMGSGSTAIASRNLNRNYVGFELSQEYCEMIKSRLNKSNNQKLNDWF